ncbi:16S rRNA processing protein RimM [Ichthyobacterium seriolicida]|uniref:16S rRNA processing protein RimM n=2 Tax=Ichthyobacterium seriolicida TaxID=242600 RepID=A0A1J1DY82_9FLAO|nr:16S rRNA processing protein RimM [Ichthyobacterium seriolicida]
MLIPFFIEYYRIISDSLIRVKFTDINDDVSVLEILKSDVYLPLSLLPSLREETVSYKDLIEFRVIDEVFGDIGVLKEVNDSSPQMFLDVDFNGKDILIPVHEDIVKDVDYVKRQIMVKCPGGLIDFYLNN